MVTMEALMKQVFEKENQGYYEEGILILKEASKSSPELYLDIVYELSMLYFRNGDYYLALAELIEIYYLCRSDEILSFIFEAYAIPNVSDYQKNYTENKKILETYPHLYSEPLPSFENIELTVIWEDDQRIIYFLEGKFIARVYVRLNENNVEQRLLIVNAFDIKNLLEFEEINRRYSICISTTVYGLDPIYLYYSRYDFWSLLCVNSLRDIVDRERFVFLIEKVSVELFFDDLQTKFPDRVISYNNYDMHTELEDLVEKRRKKIIRMKEEGKEQIKKYYEEHEKEIMLRIRSGKPKIMVITSRFTTVLQHHARNFYYAAKKRGLDVLFFIEKSNIHKTDENYFWDELCKNKPDVILAINHFRYEIFNKGEIAQPIFLTWIQDPMPYVMDKNTPKKLLEHDFLLNHFISWKDFFDVGYDKDKIIDASVPSNQDVYKSYKLSEREKERYNCDICLVCHVRGIYNIIEDECKKYDDVTVKDVIGKMYLAYYRQALEKEEFCYSIQEFRDFVKHYFIKEHNMPISDDAQEIFATNMFSTYGANVYRHVLVEWILDHGYKNVKLWGDGWDQTERFIPYAMGVAENGEVLSKILQASKIVIGNNCNTTAAARVWETMLSGGFYLSNYIPKESDAVDIRMILDPEDYVMFHSKSDLLEKIEYYLNHETERINMEEKGRKKALEKMTFDVLLDRTLNKLKEKLTD